MASTKEAGFADQQTPTRMGAGSYMASRLSTLKPPMTAVGNPFKQLRLLNGEQWSFFGVSPSPFEIRSREQQELTKTQVAWCGWVWDAFDFFTVSLTVTQLAKEFHKSNSQITWGITVWLL
jgi:MFS transporter, SHS family, lactate transporter